MATAYLFQLGSWAYDCEFGCFDMGYDSEIKAAAAEESHDCMHARFPRATEAAS